MHGICKLNIQRAIAQVPCITKQKDNVNSDYNIGETTTAWKKYAQKHSEELLNVFQTGTILYKLTHTVAFE